MSAKTLCIDIRRQAVSAVMIRSKIKETKIESYQRILFPDETPADHHIASSLEKIAETMDVKKASCALALPADIVMYRNIRVPFKGRKKIEQILPFELETSLPVPIDDLVIDFQICGYNEQTGYSDLLAAAVKKSDLQFYLSALTSLNIDPEIVTISGYSAAHVRKQNSERSGCGIYLDLDTRQSTLFMFLSGTLHLIRSFPLSRDEQDIPEQLHAQIQRTITGFEELFDLTYEPESIHVNGLKDDGNEFCSALSERLGVTVKKTDAKVFGDDIKGLPAGNGDLNRIDHALALFFSETGKIKGLNFRKGPYARKKYLKEHKKGLILSSALVVTLLLLMLFNVFLDVRYKKKQLSQLNRQINQVFLSAFPDVKRISDPIHQMKEKLKGLQQAPAFSGEHKRTVPVMDILNGISRMIPEKIDVDLNRLIVGEDHILLSGRTDTFNAVDEIKSRLEKEKLFGPITISSTNKDKSGNRVRFKIKIER